MKKVGDNSTTVKLHDDRIQKVFDEMRNHDRSMRQMKEEVVSFESLLRDFTNDMQDQMVKLRKELVD